MSLSSLELCLNLIQLTNSNLVLSMLGVYTKNGPKYKKFFLKS